MKILNNTELKRLPAWAVTAYTDLLYAFNENTKRLNDVLGVVPSSPFSETIFYRTPEGKMAFRDVFFQADKMTVRHAGVCLDVHLTAPGDGQREGGIELSFSMEDGETDNVAVLATGRGKIELVKMTKPPTQP